MLFYLLGLVVLLVLYRWYRETKRVSPADKYVYITGCDSGFGNLLAKHLDKLGFCVIASCFTEKGEEELKKASSERLTTIHLDVTQTESVSRAAAFIKTKVGGKGELFGNLKKVEFMASYIRPAVCQKICLWAVVNNAGVSVPSAPCDWLTIEDYKSMLNVNLNGVIAVTLSVLPLIKKARGRVVNVASVFGRISPFGGPYCISKYGVEAFNDSLRLNMVPFGVKVLCIEPGFFRTSVTDINILGRNVQKLWNLLPQETKEEYGSDYMDKVNKMMKEEFDRLPDADLMKVVRCMEHGVAAVHPRTRYSPGWDAKFFWIPMSYMPTCIADYMLLKNVIKPAKSVV